MYFKHERNMLFLGSFTGPKSVPGYEGRQFDLYLGTEDGSLKARMCLLARFGNKPHEIERGWESDSPALREARKRAEARYFPKPMGVAA